MTYLRVCDQTQFICVCAYGRMTLAMIGKNSVLMIRIGLQLPNPLLNEND